MATAPESAATKTAADEPASYLDMPSERRTLAKAHVATLSATAAKVALALPIGADVDDFRRVLAAEAKP
ncbi:MAG TPA: hypothetical protein VFI87_11445 [Hyphomicrobiaceae bacterium]|jgi:hypothetical protein|nr:hypothetical protein [Hyphomicrobiaceae bacterium]